MENKEQAVPPFALGGLPSPRDYRDVPMSAVFGAPKDLPASYRANTAALPIWNQKKIGSCVGHAAAKKKQAQEFDETGTIIRFNPRFVYTLAKSQDGYAGEGTFYRLGMKVMQQTGCPEEIEGYGNDAELTHAEYIDASKIPKAAYDAAGKYRIASYAQVGYYQNITADDLKQAIYEGDGCLLGLQLGSEWWTDANGNPSWNAADILPLRTPKAVVSGHAVFLDGYETTPDGRLKFYGINSWSEAWGDHGRFEFWYDEYRPFLVEAWSAVDLPNDWQEKLKELPSAGTFKHFFATDVEIKSRGEEVKALQTALMIDGEFDRALFAELLKTEQLGYYGEVTRKAVAAFQKKYAVAAPAVLNAVNGNRIGQKTRNKLNELFNK